MRRALAQLATTPATAALPATVGEDTAARLRSLGYSSSAAPARTQFTEDDDPKRLVALSERFNTALEAFNAGRSADALAEFLALLRERADFLTARTSAATVLIATGRPADAVTLLRAAPAEQASAPEILARLGTALQQCIGAAAVDERLGEVRLEGSHVLRAAHRRAPA